jgi:hypothetical protein
MFPACTTLTGLGHIVVAPLFGERRRILLEIIPLHASELRVELSIFVERAATPDMVREHPRYHGVNDNQVPPRPQVSACPRLVYSEGRYDGYRPIQLVGMALVIVFM